MPHNSARFHPFWPPKNLHVKNLITCTKMQIRSKNQMPGMRSALFLIQKIACNEKQKTARFVSNRDSTQGLIFF